jgi:hypothetical protein
MAEAQAGAGGGKPAIGVGMVGYAFMGAAHSQGWRTVGRVFDLPVRPVMAAISGRDGGALRAAADRLGWAAVETDWRALIERDDVQLVDIGAPGDLHAPIAIAALQAGKHVLCEKPLANTVAEAEAMAAAAAAARAAGQVAMVGFNYRRVPAIALARQLVGQGRQPRVRPGAAERAGVLRRDRGQRHSTFLAGEIPYGRVPAHPGHRARPPVPVGVVAARPHAGLGAHVQPSVPRPAARHRGRHAAGAVVRRRPAGAASAGRGSGQRVRQQRLDAGPAAGAPAGGGRPGGLTVLAG